REDLLTLQRETRASLLMEYEPFTESRPPVVRGRFVNVSAPGFRLVPDQGPWPPDPAAFTIFVFGGSTTFGTGVADAETIPAQLPPQFTAAPCARPVHVYNFARPGYFSVQERILFEQLLLAGHHPDLAIFVDGLNEVLFSKDSSKGALLKRLVDNANQRRSY